MESVVTIAGSDSCGGAGIEADLRTIAARGLHGAAVIVAVTAQNTRGVQAIQNLPVEIVAAQCDSVFSDLHVVAVKLGMLSTAALMRAVAAKLRQYAPPRIVLDPVMVSQTGHRLMSEDAITTLRQEVLPLADVITPNLPEAAELLGRPVATLAEMRQAAGDLHALLLRRRALPRGASPVVLVKGGHLKGAPIDIFFDGGGAREISAARIDTPNTHGTGCTLSSAIAAELGKGAAPLEAVRTAKAFLSEGLAHSLAIGGGPGCPNQMFQLGGSGERRLLLGELVEAFERLRAARVGRLIPEVQSNLAAGLLGARGREEVAAFPGRLTRLGDTITTPLPPCFGASRHVAGIVLEAMQFDGRIRAVMNLRYEPRILAACEQLGLRLGSFDRADEPKEVKEREGSSLEWGTRQAILASGCVPDVIYDLGERGKEPMIRLLGPSPAHIAELVLRINERLG
ncbi:MAG: bifunctional hydroxymethylpyrimidine kinase/phosphomethylpyrimidine kinase [Candidatus Tectomicrobia bacterium]|nr:bifunctional hydroxymethylpyrimidine kinase/phosphomethylpyrimidine kinase [Candidatus Tectomicrobia bacterium]